MAAENYLEVTLVSLWKHISLPTNTANKAVLNVLFISFIFEACNNFCVIFSGLQTIRSALSPINKSGNPTHPHKHIKCN